MNLNYSEYSDIGGRSVNEDMVQVTSHQDCVIAMVADGLGGHGNGDIASRMVVSAISENIRNSAASKTMAEAAIRDANERMMAKQEKVHNNMKTTIALLWLNDTKACAAHVGDTRIYQFRDGKIIFQTKDHSVPQMEINLGHISQEQIRGHVDRNRLTRALGYKRDVIIDSEMLTVQSGDAFLLCSDGFWEVIWENEMIDTLKKSKDAKSWLKEMLDLLSVRLTTESDNNTAIALCVN